MNNIENITSNEQEQIDNELCKEFEFFKKIIESETSDKKVSKKNVKILKILFNQLKDSDEKIKRDFLKQLNNQSGLTKVISNNSNLTKYFVNCFITEETFFCTDNNQTRLNYISILSEITKNNPELASAILNSEHFNKASYLNYDTVVNVFPENLLVTVLNNNLEKTNIITDVSKKLDTHRVLRFSILKKYQELSLKSKLSKNEQQLLKNLELILKKSKINHKLTKKAIYKIQKKKSGSKKIQINDKNMDEAIDLIYLGLIKSEDISIDDESFKKCLIIFGLKKIQN